MGISESNQQPCRIWSCTIIKLRKLKDWQNNPIGKQCKKDSNPQRKGGKGNKTNETRAKARQGIN